MFAIVSRLKWYIRLFLKFGKFYVIQESLGGGPFNLAHHVHIIQICVHVQILRIRIHVHKLRGHIENTGRYACTGSHGRHGGDGAHRKS